MKSRREFISNALIGLLGLFGLGFLVPGLAILSPAGGRSKKTVYFPLAAEEEIPRAGVKKNELVYTVAGRQRKARVFIVGSVKGPVVLSATCSHLGCLVNYQREKAEFVCPCHGGRYDITGKNVAGPPPAPLNSLPIRIEDGFLLVGLRV